MSIIQDIRDKYAKVAVVAIALALIGFILTDYFSGKARGGGGGSNSLGSVNGKTIRADQFSKKLEGAEAQLRSQGYPAAMASQQAIEQVWNGEVNNVLIESETDKLGITIGNKELGDMLYGPNAPEDLKRQLSDSTGYDPVRAKQQIDRMLKDPKTPPEQIESFNNYVAQLKQMRLTDKLTSLLANSINFPRWYVEKQTADNSLIGKISMVREFYSSIPDSAVKIDDKEIADYVSKHKDDFKQEESRSISYVTFNASPSASDSLLVKDQLAQLKPEMDTTNDIAGFLAKNGVSGWTENYLKVDQLGVAKDTIMRMAKNQVFGPFIEGPTYAMIKLLDTRVLPDSVKARHILINTATQDPSTGRFVPSRDTVEAYRLIDSVRNLISKGANFDSMVVKFSEDQGSKAKGGVYEKVYYGQMVPEFNEFIFTKPPGSKGIVKTDFGYHYVEVLQHEGSETMYKFARLPMDIVPSRETDDKALEEATQFASDSRDQKGFDELYEKTQKAKGRVKGVQQNIKPGAGQIEGLGFSRSLVRNIYDAKLGEVLQPERVDDSYVVVAVTGVYKEGTKDAQTARPLVEPILRNQKKAAILSKKIGKVTTLEAAATALGGKQIEVLDSIRINATGALGYEPRVSGAIFNPANKGKVVPEVIEGVSGVYVIRVENVTATPSTSGDVAGQRSSMYQQTKQTMISQGAPGHPLNILKTTASIKDKRSERY